MKIIEYETQYADDVIKLWRKSKRQALGDYTEKHNYDAMLQYLSQIMAVEQQVFLGINHNKLVGFMALHKNWIEQLYIDINRLNAGFGSQFMGLAKQISPVHLQAYCFERNIPARQFYEKHGFLATEFGDSNEENLPDILFKWNN